METDRKQRGREQEEVLQVLRVTLTVWSKEEVATLA